MFASLRRRALAKPVTAWLVRLPRRIVITIVAFALAAGMIGVQTMSASVARAAAWQRDEPGVDTVGATATADRAAKSSKNALGGTAPAVDPEALYGIDGPGRTYANVVKISTTDATGARQFAFASQPTRREQTMLAVDSGGGGGQEGYYLWRRGPQDGFEKGRFPLWHVPPGASAPTKAYSVPGFEYFGHAAAGTARTTGGAVDQVTGRVHLAGGRDAFIGRDGGLRLSVFDPKTLRTYWSGALRPRTPSDDLWRHEPTAGFTTPGRVSDGLALTASGDYLLLIKGTDVAIPADDPVNTTGTDVAAGSVDVSFLVRVRPSFTNDPWTYSVMKMVTRDPADESPMTTLNERQSGLAFSGGKLLLAVSSHLVEIDPGTGHWRHVGEVGPGPRPADDPRSADDPIPAGIFASLASAQTAVAVTGTVRDDPAASGAFDASAAGIPGVTMALYEKTSGRPALAGTTVTDGSGDYTFVIPKTAQDGSVRYYVRPVRPRIDGKKATVTAGSVVSDTVAGVENSTGLTCADGTSLDGSGDGERVSGACPGGADPALEAVGAEVDPASFGAYGTMTMRGGWSDPRIDFTLTRHQAVDPARSTLAVSPAGPLPVGAKADSTYTATVTAKDANGDLVAGARVGLSVTRLDGSVGAGPALSATHCVTGADGKCQATLTSTRAGTFKVLAQVPAPDGVGPADLSGSPAAVKYVAGPACLREEGCAPLDPAHTTRVAVTVDHAVADGVAADVVTGYAFDQYGNPTRAAFDLAAAEPALRFGASSVTTEADGVVRADATSLKMGSFPATVRIGATELTQSGSPLTLAFVADEPDPAHSLLSVSAPAAVAGGSVDAIAAVRDVRNNPVAGVRVELTAGGSATLSAPSCLTGADGNCSVRVSDAAAEKIWVSAAMPGKGAAVELAHSPKAVAFSPSDIQASKSSFTVSMTPANSAAASVVANGRDSWTGVVTLKDGAGNPIPGRTDVTFAVAPDVTASEVEDRGDGSYAVTFTATKASSRYAATAAVGGLAVGPARQLPFVAGPADPARTSLSLSADRAQVGGRVTATVVAKDADGNPVEAADIVVTTSGSATIGGASAATCRTDAAGACAKELTGPVAQTAIVRARLGEADVVGSPTTAVFEAGALDQAKSSFAVRPTVAGGARVVADGVDSWTGVLTARDGRGGLLKNLDPAQLAFTARRTSPRPVTVSSVVNRADGTYTVTFTSVGAGGATAAVAYGGLSVGAEQPIPFVAGPADPARSTLAVPAQAALGGATPATAMFADAHGNPVAGARVDFSATGAAKLDSAWCETTADGACSVMVSDNAVETVAVSASVDGVAVSNSPQPVEFTSGAFDADKSELTVEATTPGAAKVVADGVDSWTAVLTARDAHGNPLSGLDASRVRFAADPAVTLTQVSGLGDGRYTARLTTTTAGTFDVSAGYDGGADVPGSPTRVAFVAGAPDPGRSKLAVDPVSVTVGEDAGAAALIADANGNPVGGVRVDFTQDGSGAFSRTWCVTDRAGGCGVRVTDKGAEAIAVGARVEVGGVPTDVAASPVTVTFGHGQVSAEHSTLTVAPNRQTAGAPVVVTLTVRDDHDNPMPDLPRNWFAARGAAAGLPDLAADDWADLGRGVYTFQATSKLAGAFRLDAVVGGVRLPQRPTATFVAGAVCVSNCTPVVETHRTGFVTTRTDQVADGRASAEVTAHAYDTYGNPIAGAPVVITDQTGSVRLGRLAPAKATTSTDAHGLATVDFVTATAGTYAVNGTIGGLRPADTGVITDLRFIPGGADAGRSSLAVDPALLPVGAVSIARVVTNDAAGNPVGGVPVTFTADSANVTFSGRASGRCTTLASGPSVGVCEVPVTSLLAGTYGVSARIGTALIDGSPARVTFTAGEVCFTGCTPVDPTHLTRVLLTKDGAAADGVDANEATAFAYDRYGNPVRDARVQTAAGAPTLMVATGSAPTGADGRAVLTYVSRTAGPVTASVTIDAVGPASSPVTMTFATGKGDPALSSVSIEPKASQPVDSTFTLTAVVRDSSDRPVGNAVVAFRADPGADTSADTCVTDADGVCRVRVTSAAVGTYKVAATIQNPLGAGLPVSGSPASATFTAGPVCVAPVCTPDVGAPLTRARVTTNGAAADGVGRDLVTVWAYDRHGNPVPDVQVASSAADAMVQPSVAATGPDGRTTIWHTSLTAGAHPADVTVRGLPVSGSPVSLAFGDGVGDPTRSKFTIAPATPGVSTPLTVGEDGVNAYRVEAIVRDRSGKPVAGAVVSFGTAPDGPSWGPAACATGADGRCSALVSSTRAGTYAVDARLGAEPIGDAQPATWKADGVCAGDCAPADPNLPEQQRTRVEVTTDDQLANGAAKGFATLWAFDRWGNPVQGAKVASDPGDASLVVQSAIAGTNDRGMTTVFYQTTVAGRHPADVTVDGQRPSGSPVSLSFGANTADPSKSALTVAPATQTVGKTVVVTATAKDRFGNLVANVPITIASGGSSVLSPASPATCLTSATAGAGYGSCQLTLTDTRAEAVKVTAAADIGGVRTPVTGSPARVVFTTGCLPGIDLNCAYQPGVDNDHRTGVRVTTDNQKAGGIGTDVATLRLFDLFGNPVPGRPVRSTTDASQLSIGAPVAATDAAGTAVIGYQAKKAGGFEAELTVAGAEVKFVPQPGTVVDAAALSSPVSLSFVRASASDAPAIASPSDGAVTGDPSVTITGTGRPGATITVADGGQEVCGQTVAADGAWQCGATLDDGRHELVAAQAGSDGGRSADSKIVLVTVDTVSPPVPKVDHPVLGHLTNDNKPTVDGTGEPGSTVAVAEDGDELCVAAVLSNGTWSCRPVGPLPDGEHSVSVSATDPAGNESSSAQVQFEVDTAPPSVRKVEHPVPGELTGDATPTFDGTGDPGATVTVGQGGQELCAAPVGTDGRWSCAPSRPLSDGEHSVSVSATDPAGNESGPAQVQFEVDATRPQAPVAYPSDGTRIEGEAEPGAAVRITDDQDNLVPGCEHVVAAGTGRFSCRPKTPLAPGAVISVTATDPAGNVSAQTVAIVMDPLVVSAGDDSGWGVATGGTVSGDSAPLALTGLTLVAATAALAAGLRRRKPIGGDHG